MLMDSVHADGNGAAAPIRATAARSFIRATEIWVPSADRSRLVFGDGAYGPLTEFASVSRATTFAHDEGLPGKAWASGRPIVLKDLTGSYFKRGAAADAAGLTCAVAVPVFAGPFIMAVLVMFCGDDAEHVGAIELWHTPDGSAEMGLVDGYFGTAETFAFSASKTKFRRGYGLPGTVWETAMPVMMDDLGRSHRFLRRDDARRVGINRGIGIPCGRDDAGPWVLTLLSALGTPIARRFECWVPDARAGGLRCDDGFCELTGDMAAMHADAIVRAGDGTLAHVWQSGIPAIATDLSQGSGEHPAVVAASAAAGLTTMTAVPIVMGCRTRAVVAWYN